MSFIKSLLFIAAFFIKIITSSYRECYRAGEQHNNNNFEMWELNITNQKSSFDD
jgi:hypothetical protein